MAILPALCVFVLIGSAGSISTQAFQEPLPQMTMDKADKAKGIPMADFKVYRMFRLMSLDVKGQKILFSYGRAASDGAVLRLSGGVRFALDGTQIAANEADVDTRAGTISLSGDVTIKIIR